MKCNHCPNEIDPARRRRYRAVTCGDPHCEVKAKAEAHRRGQRRYRENRKQPGAKRGRPPGSKDKIARKKRSR